MYKAREAKLADIFDSGQYTELIVPAYQRSYVWGNDEFEGYWDDFIDTSKQGGSPLRLIGPIILSKTKADPKTFNIVDGQQRLITSSLILAAIRDVWGEVVGLDDDYHDLHRYIVSKSRSDGLRLKIRVADNLGSVYSDIIAYKSIPEVVSNSDAKSVVTAYRFFREKIKTYISTPGIHEKEKAGLLDKLVEQVFDINCILVVLENEDDAYEVFEGFNARGVDLSISDLFKNLILSKVKGEERVQQEALSQWNEIVSIVKEINVPKFNINTFLRYYWIGKNKYVTERELYKSIKQETLNYRELLKELYEVALGLRVLFSRDPYAIQEMLGDSSKYSNSINNSVLALRAMNTQSFMVWLMALISPRNKGKIKAKWFSQALRDVEIFCFRYFGISKQPANKIEKKFSELGKQLYKCIKAGNEANIPNIVIDGWKKIVEEDNLLPTDEQFLEDFQNINLQTNNKPFVRYLLSQIENHLTSEEKKVDQISVNIEHILPQKPDKSWKVTDKELKENVNRLGNITIVLEKFNSSMSNKPIMEKLSLLEQSSLEINNQIVKLVRNSGYLWDATVIGSRQTELGSVANEIWALKRD